MTQDGEPQAKRRRASAASADSQDQTTLPTYQQRGGGRTTSGPYNPKGLYYEVDEDLDTPRINTSVVRYNQPDTSSTQRITTGGRSTANSIPARRQNSGSTREIPRQSGGMTREVPRQTRMTAPSPLIVGKTVKPRKNVHWLVLVGLGMIAALALWVIGSTVLAWGMVRYDDLRYGTPRTFQTDAVVGHNNDSRVHPSHFIAMNLNHQAIVVEFMAGDPAKSVSYVVQPLITGDSASLAPITLDFRDVNGDHKLDMIVHIHLPGQGDTLSAFINDGDHFRPSTPNDKIIGY